MEKENENIYININNNTYNNNNNTINRNTNIINENNDKNKFQEKQKEKENKRITNNIIYPHLNNNLIQRKQNKFIYCYYAHVVDLRNSNEPSYKKFFGDLMSFIMKSNSEKLVGPEEIFSSKTASLKNTLNRKSGEVSCFWEFQYLNGTQKSSLDKFLIEVNNI
jgi:hypothetical protein